MSDRRKLIRPLSDSQKLCMRAGIHGHLHGYWNRAQRDQRGGVHLWLTVRSLVELGVYRQTRWVSEVATGLKFHLTEVGFLAALWLDQEDMEGM